MVCQLVETEHSLQLPGCGWPWPWICHRMQRQQRIPPWIKGTSWQFALSSALIRTALEACSLLLNGLNLAAEQRWLHALGQAIGWNHSSHNDHAKYWPNGPNRHAINRGEALTNLPSRALGRLGVPCTQHVPFVYYTCIIHVRIVYLLCIFHVLCNSLYVQIVYFVCITMMHVPFSPARSPTVTIARDSD